MSALLLAADAQCRVCGCTESQACMTENGTCIWVEPDLCSACARLVQDVCHGNGYQGDGQSCPGCAGCLDLSESCNGSGFYADGEECHGCFNCDDDY